MAQAVASRYAQALVDSVLDPKSQIEPKQALNELVSFEETLRHSGELRNVLTSPSVPIARKRSVVGRFAESLQLSRLVRNFLLVVLDRQRIGMVDEIREAFELALDERLGILRAEVKSPNPLTERQKDSLTRELSRITGKHVRAAYAIDGGMLGGVIARVGSTTYDGSIRGQLDELRRRMAGR